MNSLTSVFLRIALIFTCILADASFALAQEAYKAHTVDFNRPNGPYSQKDFCKDFGNFTTDDAYTYIVDGALRVSFPKGRKIEGLQGARVSIRPAPTCELEFRILYPKEFQVGLHGKQFGLAGGAAYTGGLGADAAKKGDGWSVRLQFDAHGDEVTNQLYVYHAGMNGKYGEDLGTRHQPLRLKRGKWHHINLRVTMQSAPEKSDGRIEVTLDDKRSIDLKNVRFVTCEKARTIDQLRIESFCGGYGPSPVAGQSVFFDDIRWDTHPAR
jgi:hypothetical protein